MTDPCASKPAHETRTASPDGINVINIGATRESGIIPLPFAL